MTKKTRIRIGIIIAIICVMGFSDWSFAVDDAKYKGIEIFGMTLNVIVSALARLWVFFAKVAGEFLTNKWIYGEFLGLDILLWKYRNVVKNFANFGLGFYFVYIILKGLFSTGKSGIEQTLKNNLLWLVVAGVGIQVSRFFTAAFIDLSTITMAAAGSLPASVMSNSPYIGGTVENSLRESFSVVGDEVKKGKELDLFSEKTNISNLLNTDDTIELEIPQTLTGLVDKMMPSAEDLSGPLYFIGFSILNTSSIPSINQASEKGLKASIFNTIVEGGSTIIYAIEMLVLCVIALIRILYLWMFIILSPLAILLRCIKQSGEKIGGTDNESLGNLITNLDIGTFLINVFKPTIIVLGLGMAVILTSLMKSIVSEIPSTINDTSKYDFGGVSFSSRENSDRNGQTEGDVTYTTTMDHNMFSFTLANVGKPLLDLILSILTVFLVYEIIKLAVSIGNGKDFLGKRVGNIQKTVGEVLGKTPIIPVTGYNEKGEKTTQFIRAGSVFGLGNESSIISKKIATYQDRVDQRYTDQENIVNSWFGKKRTKWLENGYKNQIRQNATNNRNTGLSILESYIAGIRERGKKPEKEGGLPDGYGYGMTLNPSASDTRWQERFRDWLKNVNPDSITGKNTEIWRTMVTRWKGSEAQEIEEKMRIKKMFTETNFKDQAIKAYAELFGLGNITTWEDLMNADFSVKK